MSFEDYLESIGYVRHVYDYKNSRFVPDANARGAYSTYGPLNYTFIKDDVEIQYGLSQAGKPPTLYTKPRCRPLELELKKMQDNYNTEYSAYKRGEGMTPKPMEWSYHDNAYGDRIMSRYTYAEVEEAIRCKTVLE